MLHYLVQGTQAPLTAVRQAVLYFRFPIDCRIRRVDVYAGASSISGDAVFNLRAGSAPGSLTTIFASPADRPRISTGALSGSATGLDVGVPAGSIGALDLDQMPPGGVFAPVFCIVTVDDQLTVTPDAAAIRTAVGAMLLDSAEVDFTFDSGAGTETAALKETGVAAGTYGSASKSPVVTVDAKGRVTSIGEATISGGGSGSTETTPDTPPAVANALDDEFAGSALASKWTSIGQAGASHTVSLGRYVCRGPAPSAWNALQAIQQPITNADFDIRAKMSLTWPNDGSLRVFAGLLLRNVSSNQGAILYGFGKASGASVAESHTVLEYWTSALAYSSVIGGAGFLPGLPQKFYLRATRVGALVTLYWSMDGTEWAYADGANLSGLLPAGIDRVGVFLVADSPNSTRSAVMTCEWFRAV